eukprot:3289000-Alexandrium_andersonii.AAC.1
MEQAKSERGDGGDPKDRSERLKAIAKMLEEDGEEELATTIHARVPPPPPGVPEHSARKIFNQAVRFADGCKERVAASERRAEAARSRLKEIEEEVE